MADTYAASKQINAQLSNINAGGQALSTVDSLSTLKLLSHFDSNAPANVKAAQAKVTSNELAFLRAGMLGVQNIKQLGDRLGRDLQGSMALANLLRNRQADRVSNTLLDLVLQQNASTQLENTVKSLGGDAAIFEAGEADDEEY
jgi:hypothetical protein